MGLKTYSIDFFELHSKESLRLWIPFVLPNSKFRYDKINKYLSPIETGNRPTGGIREEDRGEAISIGGEQIGIDGNINLSKVPYISHDFYKNAKKGKIRDKDILICKDGALTGKTCLVDFSIFPTKEVMVNEHVYILRGNENIDQKFLYFYTTTNLFQSQVKDLAYKKKAQPGLNLDNIKKIKIPKVPKPVQVQIVSQIKPIEKKIETLRSIIQAPQDIINRVFVGEFNIDLQKVQKEEQRKQFLVTSTLLFRNPNIRSSVRWHKIAPIQQVMYENINCIMNLGDFIISTKNGWSPICRDSDTVNLVFGLNCISETGVIDYEDIKTSDDTCAKVDSYCAKNHDLFVSRGNTVDLVALASVVEDLPEDRNVIYPDLFIKLDIDESRLDKYYLALLFNSLIGRYYFKYSSKGKNQSMVKISTEELYGFYLPVPKLEIQQKIVDLIKLELKTIEKIKLDILVEQRKIAEIVENNINLKE